MPDEASMGEREGGGGGGTRHRGVLTAVQRGEKEPRRGGSGGGVMLGLNSGD